MSRAAQRGDFGTSVEIDPAAPGNRKYATTAAMAANCEPSTATIAMLSRGAPRRGRRTEDLADARHDDERQARAGHRRTDAGGRAAAPR